MRVIGGRTQRRYVKERKGLFEQWVVEYGPGVTSVVGMSLEDMLRAERSLTVEEDTP